MPKTISINETHIKKACRKDSHNCMIACAIKDAYPDASFIRVDVRDISFSRRGERRRYFTPPTCQLALVKFDQGQKVDPFTFQLPTECIIKKAGFAATNPNTTKEDRARIQRKYLRRKKSGLTRKTVHTVREREFGMRKLV